MNLIEEITKNSIKKKEKIKKNKGVLNKRYFCAEELAKGGLSTIYKGIDIYSEYFGKDSNIVIKIPSDELLKKDDICAFTYAEYNFLRRLNHDNIVKVLDFGIDRKTDIPYLVLEHINGMLLSEIPLERMCLSVKNQVFKSLHNTLKYVHSKNIIHADITPINIILNDANSPIIFDFGISQSVEEESFALEYKKVKAFNPKYSAPELIQDIESKPTIYSDIFSFACVMYELYSNKQLFKESSLELLENPIKMRDLSQVPLSLKRWFKYALNAIPEKRYLKRYYKI
ncbi:hypothetical protein CRV08_10350 [Halarcobacter ebronensis]|uniref:Protein kinase domain-containing protein n=1 Tax=Halarcobacter ebronensis TaxID=1462615 RepID=A0A4Q0YAL2_9BACT|nr:serine/threonine-protein kinase [Halarcobacter ebronensis]RXJ67320.1 hypothetical protein CRV08_10350 [Halarcobacter ebronensis]